MATEPHDTQDDPAQESEPERRDRERSQREYKAAETESLDAKTTYEVIRREGVKELDRTTAALLWSGLAAGLSMGFSFLGEGFLRSHLPDASWSPLISKLGYSFGFIIVIIGSQQLFTENTLTPIVPLLSERTRDKLRNVGRLWSAVLAANLIGSLLFALALARLPVVEPEMRHALSDLSADAMKYGVWTTMLHAVYAGWLVALMVWMLPGAESAKFAVIVLMTWLIGVGGFAHVIAGSTEVFYAALRGEASWFDAVLGYILPTLVGNVTGGVTLVAALNHAQATTGE